MNRQSRSVRLEKLTPKTRYSICVLGLGNWISSTDMSHTQPHIMRSNDTTIRDTSYENTDETEVFGDSILPLLIDSPTSRCTEVYTLDAPNTFIHNGINGLDSRISDRSVASILTRRLGLIIGCGLGVVVFIVLVTVLGYLKIKKHHPGDDKRNEAIPPEYLSYRHFSIQSGEANRGVSGPCGGGDHGGHPHFITTMGSSLN